LTTPHELEIGHGSDDGASVASTAPTVVRKAAQRALEVPGFLSALLFSPAGSEARPLVVATHGAGGSPEWACEHWRQLTHERVFVLCLRGKSMGPAGGYYYPDHRALEAELIAAEQAARAVEPRLLAGSGLYAGFSQGASMGSVMLPAHGARFPYLALVEGFELWSLSRAKAFHDSGGKRVLFTCGTRECQGKAQQSVRWLQQRGVDAKLDYAIGAGHTPGGEVERALERSLPWLLADESAFGLAAE
jgi:predicted esterase